MAKKCGLCGKEYEDLIDHTRNDPDHRAALRKMLDSPLTEPDPRRNKGYKDQPERRKTGSLGDKKDE